MTFTSLKENSFLPSVAIIMDELSKVYKEDNKMMIERQAQLDKLKALRMV